MGGEIKKLEANSLLGWVDKERHSGLTLPSSRPSKGYSRGHFLQPSTLLWLKRHPYPLQLRPFESLGPPQYLYGVSRADIQCSHVDKKMKDQEGPMTWVPYPQSRQLEG